MGFFRIAERAGIRQMLADASFDSSASRALARIIYWLILLLFVIAAAESLGLAGVVDTLEALIAYLPNVLAAALILLLGSLLAGIVGDAVGGMALGAGGGGIVGMVVRRGARLAAAGIVLGLVGVWATTSIAETLVYGVAALDLVSLLAGCLVLATVAVSASTPSTT